MADASGGGSKYRYVSRKRRTKEDRRFITGKGRYTDDINRPGQSYAVFVRSQYAHATIKKIDTGKASSAPGVLAIYTGEDIANDQVGGLICGWMIHSKDGEPMKAGAHPALAQGKVRYVGDHVAVVIADTLAQAKDAAELVEVDYDADTVELDTEALALLSWLDGTADISSLRLRACAAFGRSIMTAEIGRLLGELEEMGFLVIK